MQLSLRLETIAGMVTRGNRLVDVGCDHGYLPVFLLQQGIIPSAIAMDVRPGPLSRAREHISQYGYENLIETRLSDGLEGLSPGEGDTLVIAGMGGPLMEQILSAHIPVRNSFKEMILQPQSHIPHFRQYLLNQGLIITDENLVEEDGKFYPMMKAIPGRGRHESWSPDEIAYGRYLIRSHHPVLKPYLYREKRIRLTILENLRSAGIGNGDDRYIEVEKEVEQIQRLEDTCIQKN